MATIPAFNVPAPTIHVYPPQRRGNFWIGTGSLTFGDSDPIFVSAHVSNKMVAQAVAAIIAGTRRVQDVSRPPSAPTAPSATAYGTAYGIPGFVAPHAPPAPAGGPPIGAVVQGIQGMASAFGGQGGGGASPFGGGASPFGGVASALGNAFSGIGAPPHGGGMPGGGGGMPGGRGGTPGGWGGAVPSGGWGAVRGYPFGGGGWSYGYGGYPFGGAGWPYGYADFDGSQEFGAIGAESGEMIVKIREGWNPRALASHYTGDPERWRELLELNRIEVSPDGWARPWFTGMPLRIPAHWQPVMREPPPPVRKVIVNLPQDVVENVQERFVISGDEGAATHQVATAMTSGGVTKTAMDAAELIPCIGILIRLTRGAASLADGVMAGQPEALDIVRKLQAYARQGHESAETLLSHAADSERAIHTLEAANAGSLKAAADILRLETDARGGSPDAVRGLYILEGARDVITPDYREEEEAKGDRQAMIRPDPLMVEAVNLFDSLGGGNLRNPSPHNQRWFGDVVRKIAVGCANRVGCGCG